ncbi:MAG: hypothetical protein J0M04_20570 [Verrucomicrobia bacterium]|nr:hypothetical protein [Verrucomicrobiota bacterium]
MIKFRESHLLQPTSSGCALTSCYATADGVTTLRLYDDRNPIAEYSIAEYSGQTPHKTQ